VRQSKAETIRLLPTILAFAVSCLTGSLLFDPSSSKAESCNRLTYSLCVRLSARKSRIRLGTLRVPGSSLIKSFSSSRSEEADKAATEVSSQARRYRNAAPEVAYLGSKACAMCHRDIYDSYVKTGMGRSMSLANQPAQLERVPSLITVEDNKANRHFQVFRTGSGIHQREYELDPSGKQVFDRTEKLEYVIGSGEVGSTYVIRKDEYLFEAPLSFYSRPKTWGLSPGYELHDYGFNRPITSQCIVCHSGLSQPPSSANGERVSPLDPFRGPSSSFRELAIACENCHGPGQLHVEERLKGAPISGDVDTTIVNPAKLPLWLANNICMNCHQGGDARVLRPGKSLFDFRPGTPLDDTLVIFEIPPKREAPPQSPLLGHYYGMVLSRCYLQSGERLSCLTCHDPHQQPASQEAPAYFRTKCLSCHSDRSCKLPLGARQRQRLSDDCVRCHMVQRNLKEISHGALTDHRIIAIEGEPYPDSAFRQTTPELPDLIRLTAIPGSRNDLLPPIALLDAYQQLTSTNPQAYQERQVAVLKQLAKTESNNPVVQSALAQNVLRERSSRSETEAMRYLARAVELGSTNPTDYLRLGDLLARFGHTSDSVEILQRGIRLAPYNGLLYRSLALRYIAMGEYSQATEAAKQAFQLVPDDVTTRMLLKSLEEVPAAPHTP